MIDGPIHHVGVVVEAIEESVARYEKLTGRVASAVVELPSMGIRLAFVGSLELIEPTSPDGPVGRFLVARGAGLHHIAFAVDDLAATMEKMISSGVRFVDETPRVGAEGHLIAFLHPDSTGESLIELVQADPRHSISEKA